MNADWLIVLALLAAVLSGRTLRQFKKMLDDDEDDQDPPAAA